RLAAMAAAPKPSNWETRLSRSGNTGVFTISGPWLFAVPSATRKRCTISSARSLCDPPRRTCMSRGLCVTPIWGTTPPLGVTSISGVYSRARKADGNEPSGGSAALLRADRDDNPFYQLVEATALDQLLTRAAKERLWPIPLRSYGDQFNVSGR